MTFKQAEPIGITDPSNTIEIWDDGHHVATIHSLIRGVHIQCEDGYEPDANGMAIEVQRPGGVIVGLRRS